ncbi:diaminopimelate decarboxylase [Garciella nitratireducens]|uniref:diaminopimelate decarboxylase n=1 Tax=Garciella nitratireducens TaxID=218205 RepID=UPI000DEADD1A|nr:diaminopimelate decarboxylase [Garciella nitratireducens]RBP45576.1 diaminopimelate decarboxylase [Garciella nitratireducens]
MKIDNNNHFIFSGHDTVELAKKFGTPLYVLSEDIIRKNAIKIIKAFEKENVDFQIIYAGKALLNIAMCYIIKDLNMGLDVVSGGELYTAKKASFPMEKIYFHGNNKSKEELNMAIDLGVGRIVVDSEYELELLNHLCIEKNKKASVLFRINPGIEAHTHKYIQTGQEDSKFGISIKEAKNFIEKARNMQGIIIKGLHCHIGSQILEEYPYKIAAKIMMDLIKELKIKYKLVIEELNLGGGFGIEYLKGDSCFSAEKIVNEILKTIQDQSLKYQVKIPKIIIEPGRYVVGNAGITLYEIGAIKNIPGIRKYVSVNGGMVDNPRTALYDAKYHAVIANKVNEKEKELVSISGKCCESGDMLIWDIPLPVCEPGDILAVLATGAYNYSMASNYNRIPKPPMILLKGSKAEIIVKGETYEDIIRNDKIPTWLLE